nr:DUF3990 domain-containing protein [uncultured Prevotella sp.]
MKLLHGSYIEINKPDLSKCKSHNDFGKGFYLTPNWKRAWQMGKRSSALHQGCIVVNSFLFYPKLCEQKGLKIKTFEGFTAEWAKFILLNRTSPVFKHNYDIVIGPVADAFVEQEIAKYKAAFKANYMEEDSLKEFASRISQFGNEYIQYCFCTQRAIDELIKE